MICKKCRKDKSEESFRIDLKTRTGFRGSCRACERAYTRAHYQANIEKRRAYSKAYKKANHEKIKVSRKNYRESNKDKIRIRVKRWREANKNITSTYGKVYRKNNKGKIKSYKTAYKKANADKNREHARRRNALKRGNGHEGYREIYIFERDGWMCGICGQKINKRLKYPNPRSKSIDHIIPLSKGGSDAPVNVQATHLRCNMGKYNKTGFQLRLIG